MREKAHRSCPFLEEARRGDEEAVKPCFVIEVRHCRQTPLVMECTASKLYRIGLILGIKWLFRSALSAIQMDRKAFMASATGDERIMRDFYEKSIIIKHKELNRREGLLVDIYEPQTIFRMIRRTLCPECFQD